MFPSPYWWESARHSRIHNICLVAFLSPTICSRFINYSSSHSWYAFGFVSSVRWTVLYTLSGVPLNSPFSLFKGAEWLNLSCGEFHLPSRVGLFGVGPHDVHQELMHDIPDPVELRANLWLNGRWKQPRYKIHRCTELRAVLPTSRTKPNVVKIEYRS